MDPLYPLVALMFAVAIFGLGFQAGLNKAKRDERTRQLFLRRFLRGQR
jgi:hypothetical protein